MTDITLHDADGKPVAIVEVDAENPPTVEELRALFAEELERNDAPPEVWRAAMVLSDRAIEDLADFRPNPIQERVLEVDDFADSHADEQTSGMQAACERMGVDFDAARRVAIDRGLWLYGVFNWPNTPGVIEEIASGLSAAWMQGFVAGHAMEGWDPDD